MSRPDPSKYPEHAKLREVADKTQYVHDFIAWCEERGFCLEQKSGAHKTLSDLLYEFTGIDRWKLDDEKRAMLDECRDARAGSAPK